MEYDTREKITPLGVIDPEIVEYLQSLPPYATDLGDHMKPDTDNEYSVKIPMRDGYQSETRIHKPSTTPDAKSPVVVLIFGGGFVMGDCHQMNPYARVATSLFNATVINISYRLAPANPFPAAPNDVWDGLKWVVENAHTLGADLSAGFVIGGVSAGANLAAVAAQKAIDEGLTPAMSGVWLCYPLLLDEANVPQQYRDVFFSRVQCADAPICGTENLEQIKAAYMPNVKSPDYSPFNAKSPHKGMPPTFLQVSGMDPVRDDGLIYERALKEHGVKTRLDVYPGATHAHLIFPGVKSSVKAQSDIFEGLAWLLEKPISQDALKKALAANPLVIS
ncbi:hypothetical protein EsH8_I_001326 [Colletotrichum jinshuiense]